MRMLGTYTATITAGALGRDGLPLRADHAWSFDVRDGQWRALTWLAESKGYGGLVLAIGEEGDAIAAWVDDTPAPAEGLTMWTKQMRPDGAWIVNVDVGVQPDISVSGVAIDRQGTVAAAWATSSEVHFAWRALAASDWRKLVLGRGETVELRVAADPRGGAVVVWRSRGDGVEPPRIRARRPLDSLGMSIQYDIDEVANDGPEVAVDGRGRAVAVWRTGGSVRASRLTQDWSTVVDIPKTTGGAKDTPRIATDDQGAAIAVWRTGDGDGDGDGEICVGRLGEEGWGMPTTLDAGRDPQISMSPGGDAIVAWTRRGVDGSQGVEAVRRGAGAIAWSDAQRRRVADRLPGHPFLAGYAFDE